MATRENTGFILNDWRVSPPQGVLTRDGKTVRLEPKAMEVLVYLASHPGEVITREALERDVWHGALVGYDAVTNTVIKLRKALQDSAREPRFIATIPKKGYQLIAVITYPDSDDAPVPASPLSNESPVEAPQKRQASPIHRTGMISATLAGMLVFGWVWLWVSTPNESTTLAETRNSLVLPSIVVLPFENLSDDPKQDYLADGITEDVITDLSRLSNLLVIASNTSLQYKGQQVTAEKVGADLNVGFVLKGSVRRLGDAIRVNAQLVNATTGFNTWAQRYDRKVAEIFTVQDEVTLSIVKALAVKISNQEQQRLVKHTTNSLQAYDFFQEGQRILQATSKEANEQAREMYRKAGELDPGYGRVYSAMAYTLTTDFRRGWTDSPVWTLDRALELAKKAVALNDSTPETYWALGFVYLLRKDYENAEKAVAQAINIAPNYADGYGLLALIKSFTGQPKEAIKFINKAIRLNPHYTIEYLNVLGVAHYVLGDYDAAIVALEQAQARNENFLQTKLFLAANYVKAGRQEDAEWVTDELQVLSPWATLTDIEKTIPFANTEIKRIFLEDLRKAGLPE